MLKRKNGELKTNPLSLSLGKVHIQDSWGYTKLQPFFPPIECLFKTERLSDVQSYGIKLHNPILGVTQNGIRVSDGEIQIHKKVTMLLNPYKWMKGEFGSFELPTTQERSQVIRNRLQSHNNAGYVGCILSIALSQSGCDHFPKIYGAYTGIAQEHQIDISDDYEELTERSWFSANIGKTFELKLSEQIHEVIQYTRSNKPPLELGDDTDLEIDSISGISGEGEPAELTKVFSETSEVEEDDESSTVSTSYIFNIESMGSIDDEEIEFGEDEPFAWAKFKNVPVQITIMEKLSGTFYELCQEHPETEKQFAWISQLIFALAFAQRSFAFTHNDLHANNVMYIPTTKEFLYYSHSGLLYKVPTYGYLIKIIDFDRGIGTIKLPGMKEGKLFMSDQFAQDEEAGGQYNTTPFYNSKYQIVKPNPSFDLVRFATSLFWDLFPNGPKFDEYRDNRIFNLFMKWMTLEDGSSVLFHKQNPKVDRYPGFHLYKAIARYSKEAIPRKEISQLSEFITESVPLGEVPLMID